MLVNAGRGPGIPVCSFLVFGHEVSPSGAVFP
jgi:hypothetical protein